MLLDPGDFDEDDLVPPRLLVGGSLYARALEGFVGILRVLAADYK